MRHAFTVDVEDWYHGIPIAAEAKRMAERRLGRGMDRLLELLEGGGSRGTFFFLGPVAEEHPEILRRVVAAGHEIGCHGWSHDLLYEMTPARFRDETRRAKDVIEQIGGVACPSYRAAYFSITRASFWALEILVELGFRFDSSIFPVHNWRYGIPDFDPNPQWVTTPAGPIAELPISVRPFGPRKLPVGGGAYFRLYPYWITRSNLRWGERAGRPQVFYLHPWELDPAHPRVAFDWKARATHYARLATTEPKLRRLFRDFRFGTLGETLESHLRGPREAATGAA
jgi:polysaccharide deacetylase family protein (PEP-CTERM system associated)